jgi:hypothetical protein
LGGGRGSGEVGSASWWEVLVEQSFCGREEVTRGYGGVGVGDAEACGGR